MSIEANKSFDTPCLAKNSKKSIFVIIGHSLEIENEPENSSPTEKYYYIKQLSLCSGALFSIYL